MNLNLSFADSSRIYLPINLDSGGEGMLLAGGGIPLRPQELMGAFALFSCSHIVVELVLR